MVKFESKIEQQVPSFMKSNVFFSYLIVTHQSTTPCKKKNQSERDQDQLARADGLP